MQGASGGQCSKSVRKKKSWHLYAQHPAHTSARASIVAMPVIANTPHKIVTAITVLVQSSVQLSQPSTSATSTPWIWNLLHSSLASQLISILKQHPCAIYSTAYTNSVAIVTVIKSNYYSCKPLTATAMTALARSVAINTTYLHIHQHLQTLELHCSFCRAFAFCDLLLSVVILFTAFALDYSLTTWDRVIHGLIYWVLMCCTVCLQYLG